MWVVFAAVKGDATDTIIQKATELGASKFLPIITQRAVVKSLRQERLSLIAMEAAEQCERLSRPPSILDPQPLYNLLASWPKGRFLILCDETSTAPPLQALSALPAGCSAALVIGPEVWRTCIGLAALTCKGRSAVHLGCSLHDECLLTRERFVQGGWTEEELARLRAVDSMVPVGLGPRILRADTAVIAALSLFQSALGDWRAAAEDGT